MYMQVCERSSETARETQKEREREGEGRRERGGDETKKGEKD